MAVSLLQTKLYVPRPQVDWVPRPRLLERLDQPRRLTLVSAPAGFGKTSLVAAWASARPARVAWLSQTPIARRSRSSTACHSSGLPAGAVPQ